MRNRIRLIVFMIAAAAIGTGALLALLPTREPQPLPAATPKPIPTTGIGAAASSLPTILPQDPIRGHPDAPLTIIEFADFTCPACAAAEPVLQALRDRYGLRLRIVWKDLPHLDRLTGSLELHVAAACAHRQDKFWQYHDALFLATAHDAIARRTLARSLGLDLPTFDACVADPATVRRIDTTEASAAFLGITSTPTFYVNGERLEAPPTLAEFERRLGPLP